MKRGIVFIIIFCFLINVIHSQQRMNLQTYSKDTLSLLTDLTFLGSNSKQYKYELLNTFHSDILNRYIVTLNDSVYLYSLKNLPFDNEFESDGNYLNVFLYDSTINKLANCTWIELEKIELKKHCIFLNLFVRTKINLKEIITVKYKFKITANRNNSETLNNYYAPKYKLKKKRTITAIMSDKR